MARARADLMARGLSPELEDIYSIAAAPRHGGVMTDSKKARFDCIWLAMA